MVKNIVLSIIILAGVLLNSCGEGAPEVMPEKKVVILEVDYTSKNFVSGNISTYETAESMIDFEAEIISTGDFGTISVNAINLDTPIFKGSTIWMGLGSIEFPVIWMTPSSFPYTETEDYVVPASGFNELYIPSVEDTNYELAWSSIQNLNIVRAYLYSNPVQKVQVLLYTPSMGPGDPSDWKWIFVLQN